MQIAVTMGLLGCAIQFQPRDHSAAQPRAGLWSKGYIPDGTVVLSRTIYHHKTPLQMRAALQLLFSTVEITSCRYLKLVIYSAY